MNIRQLILVLALVVSGTQAARGEAPGSAAAEAETPPRFARSAEGRSAAKKDLRARAAAAMPAERPAFVLEGPRISPASRRGRNKGFGSGTATATREFTDVYVYDATSEVFLDLDNDGFFHGFAVTFDADVAEGVADVFAELYLSRNGGPWNLYFTTRVFSIFGATSEDEYEVVTELDLGYPTGDYDVLIEIYDADTGDFLADYGPDDDAALAFLPLEDAERDAPVIYYDDPYYGGGAGGPLLLVLVMLLSAARQLARDRQTEARPGREPQDPV